jgi:outer membrane protein
MKNFKFLLLTFAVVFSFGLNAQRLAYVDSQQILSKIPEYAQAQGQLDNMAKTWESEVSKLRAEIDAMEKAYQAEKVLLTPKLQEEKEKEIDEKRKAALELQRKYFGPDGELFKKRQELIKPIQDQIFNAVQDVARKKRYDMVLDKSGAITLLYVDPSLDISNDVLEKMGY